MPTKFTMVAFDALRELVPEIPRHCRKIVLTLEIDEPVEIQVTFLPEDEYEEAFEKQNSKTSH